MPDDPAHLDDARSGRAIRRFDPWGVVGIAIEYDAMAALAFACDIAKRAGTDGLGHRHGRATRGICLAHDRSNRCAWAREQELQKTEWLLQGEREGRWVDDTHDSQPCLELATGGTAVHPALERRGDITRGDLAAIMKPEALAQAERVRQPVRADRLLVHHHRLRRQ